MSENDDNDYDGCKGLTWVSITALSVHFKVDGALRRVGGKNDYVYYASNSKIYQISKK